MTGDSTFNPYEPPGLPEAEPETWTTWLRRLIAPAQVMSPIESFLLGKRWIFYGVVFGISPDDRATVVARLPLAENEETHIRRNVAEAQQVLGKFLARWPQLGDILRGRKLVVSMVTSYEMNAREICRVIVPAEEWERAIKEGGEKED